MATGLEIYDVLEKSLRNGTLKHGEFLIDPNDLIDLQKLSVSNLVSRDYDRGVAIEVSRNLFNGNFSDLEKRFGITFTPSEIAPPLVPERHGA